MKTDWFHSWFHSPYYELLYYKRDRAEARQFVDALLNYLKPPPRAAFLDLACGSGRHAIYLASKGYEVTGIDLSDELIEKAKKHEHDHLSFFVHDMRNEFRINYYDYTLNLFTSFGYFDKDHENQRVLRNVFKGLKRQGIFILDFFHSDKIVSAMVRQERKNINGAEFNITREVSGRFIIKKISVTDRGKTFDFLERVRAFSPGELEKLFINAGFSIQSRFGSYDLKPFTRDSERLIIIAAKTHA